MLKKLILNSRLHSMLVLGFSSGLPLALTSSTLQAWFTQANVSVVAIGALSLVGVPYTVKFLWAPLMDTFSFTQKLGKRKSWILLAQFFLVLSLLLLANMQPSAQASLMGAAALMTAFCAASQDIAIDAYRTDTLKPGERGLGISYFIFAYRIALLVAGGLALICADYFGWRLTYSLMAVLIFLTMLPTLKVPPPAAANIQSTNFLATLRQALKDLLKHDRVFLLFLFIALYKAGDALALSLMTNFLLKGLGFSLTEVGIAFKIFSPIAIILGGVAGGLVMVKWNVYRALIIFGIAQAFSNLSFAFLALSAKDFWLMSAAICLENFCSGLSTTALLAFLMSLCNKKYSATQYALLSAISSLGRVLLGPFGGVIVLMVGWSQFYIGSFILCFPSILLLIFLKEKVINYAPATADS